jgi:hypothetical protein
VNLAILLANRVAQIHAPSQSPKSQKEKTLGRHYRPKSTRAITQLIDLIHSNPSKNPISARELRKLG